MCRPLLFLTLLLCNCRFAFLLKMGKNSIFSMYSGHLYCSNTVSYSGVHCHFFHRLVCYHCYHDWLCWLMDLVMMIHYCNGYLHRAYFPHAQYLHDYIHRVHHLDPKKRQKNNSQLIINFQFCMNLRENYTYLHFQPVEYSQSENVF